MIYNKLHFFDPCHNLHNLRNGRNFREAFYLKEVDTCHEFFDKLDKGLEMRLLCYGFNLNVDNIFIWTY